MVMHLGSSISFLLSLSRKLWHMIVNYILRDKNNILLVQALQYDTYAWGLSLISTNCMREGWDSFLKGNGPSALNDKKLFRIHGDDGVCTWW